MVGLRGYKLNPALHSYLAAGPSARRPRLRPPPCQQHPVHRRLAHGTIQKLVAEYVAGIPAAELERRYGLAKSTVLTVLRGAGVSVRYPRLSASDVARVVELYGQGLPQTEIAAQVGRSPSAVWHVLERAGLVGRRHSL
jgi:Homeodomain-like domain-containing protein